MTAPQQNVPALRFPEFVGDWCRTTIGENFEFKNGLNKEKEFFGRGTPIINFMDVYHLSVIQKKHINGFVELSDKEIANFSAKKGDVFFTRTSETISDIGMSATLTENIENCVFSGFVLRARPVNKKLETLYKSYCFAIEPVRKEIVTKSSYTTRSLTSGRLLSKVNFYYPSDIQEQQKIASFLYSVDTKIEQLNKKKSLLEQYKKGLMQKLFGQEIRFKDERGKEYPDWEEKTLNDISEIITKGTTPTSVGHQFVDVGINFIKAENITKSGAIKTDETPKISEKCDKLLRRSKLRSGDILFSIAGTLGRTAIIKEKDLPANINQALSIIRLETYVSIEFVNYVLNLSLIKKYIRKSLSTGAQPNLNLQQVGEIKICFPNLIEQQKIANFLSAIDKKIEFVTEQIKQTQTFKKGLLQQMFI